MKSTGLLLILIIVVQISNVQIGEFGKLDHNCTLDCYVSQTGDTVHVSDSLIIGKPSGPFGFKYIVQANQGVGAHMAGRNIVITQIKSFGANKKNFTLWVQFKGFGLPVFIAYDNALSSGEIINPKATMTRDQAIAKLKETKDLVDLNVVTQAYYDSLKSILSKIIVRER